MPTDAAAPPPTEPQGSPAVAAASDHALALVVRDENARLVGGLAAAFGSFDVAEESVAEAVAEALREWRRRGIPPNPGAWLATAARHNALDRVRRERVYRDKLTLLSPSSEGGGSDTADADERLPLLFGCCHPALGSSAQLALTLRAVCGLTSAQIAALTFTPESTVAQRIVRAKRKMAAAAIPLRIPEADELPARLDVVLTVISAMYTRAHLVPGADATTDRDVADDAVWLARVVADAMPREPEALGLLALLLLHRARDAARSEGGEVILLAEQDRSAWDRARIGEAQVLLERAAARKRPGRWQLQAAIAACHADAASTAETDWLQILTLYDVLQRYDPSPVVSLNRAVAVAEVTGPEAALAEVDALPLERSHLWHAVRGELLSRLGRGAEAAAANTRARELTENEAERRLLDARAGRGNGS